jgi:DNA-binding LacI/PurR family transcriptional regulator
MARGEPIGGVVVTVMSNYGFHRAMEEAGIEVGPVTRSNVYGTFNLASTEPRLSHFLSPEHRRASGVMVGRRLA